MKRITTQHNRACSIPIPVQLAQEWMDNPTITTKELAYKYNVHPDFMRVRLSLAGISNIFQAKRGYKIRRMNWGMIEIERPLIPPDYHQCKCGILIPSHHTHCIYCVKEFSILKKRKCYELQYIN